MSAKLPSKRSQGSTPPALLQSLFVVSLLLMSTIAAVYIGSSWLMSGDILFGSAYLLLGLLLFRSSAGVMINLPLCFYLTRKYSTGDLGQIASTYKKVLKVWSVTPFIKDAHYAISVSTLAFVEHTRGRFDEAEALYRESIKLIEKNKAIAYPHLAAIANNYAGLLIRQHRFDEADYLLSMSLSIWEAQKGDEWNGSAIPLCTMAALSIERDDLVSAQEYLANAQRRFEERRPRFILPDSMWQCEVTCYLLLSLLHCKKQSRAEASKYLTLALDIAHHKPVAFGTVSLYTTNKLIDEFIAAGRLDEAERILELAYTASLKHPDHPDTVLLLDQYESLLKLTGRAKEVADMRRWIRPVELKVKTLTCDT